MTILQLSVDGRKFKCQKMPRNIFNIFSCVYEFEI